MSAPRILVCPLDWGLGHAVRCVPVIRALYAAGAEPVMAAGNGALELLQKEFPGGAFLSFPGVPVTYPSRGENMFRSMLRQSPKLLRGIRDERRWVEKTVHEKNIQGVISDNRFGAYSKHVPSVYITHQIHIQTGHAFTDALARLQHARYMKNFDRVWIPDYAGTDNLSGILSHGKHIPKHATYIGLLSRFNALPVSPKLYDAALILSGPEPQRTLLEERFLQQIEAFPDKKFVLVRGKNEALETPPPHLDVLPLAGHTDILRIYAQSTHVVCRSGYTGIMEMAAAGRSAWLIPTPGQTEQEYLARYLTGRHGFNTVRQEHFSLADLRDTHSGPGAFPYSSEELHKAVQAFLADL